MSIICSSYVVSDGIIISFQKILKCTLLYYEYNVMIRKKLLHYFENKCG